jgi:hypothetical protein
MNRGHLATRYKMMPNPQTVILYRLNARDEISRQQEVEYADVRNFSESEQASGDGPSNPKSREIFLYVNELNGWDVQEYDVIRHENDWWRVDGSSLEMMDTRYRCTCTPTRAVYES